MFEQTKPVSASRRGPAAGFRRDDCAAARYTASAAQGERFEVRGPRRTGDALRALEWSEITARLNAARDLRLLLRNVSHLPIEAAAASFGDAAASYFALLDHHEPGVNLDALGQSKVLDAMTADNDANRQSRATGKTSATADGDAREMQ